MSRKAFALSIKATGIEQAIEHVDSISKSLPAKMEELLRRLSDYGELIARFDFSNALYAGTNDVEVEVNRVDESTYEVIASGKSVLFIEFGSGVIYDEHPYAFETGYLHGTYGKGKGGNTYGWVYVGEEGTGNLSQEVRDGVYRTYGNPPARAMYNAAKDMREDIKRIAREVFGS